MPPYSGTLEIDGKSIHWETTFPDTIRFKCIQCGDSCIGTRVSLYPNDMLHLDKKDIEPGQSPLERPQLKKKDDESCIFLQTDNHNNCAIYHKRPLLCREFPFKVQFLSPTLAYIDLIKRCSAITLKDHPTENHMDFSDLVKRNYLRYNRNPPTLDLNFQNEVAVWKGLAQHFDGNIFSLHESVAGAQKKIDPSFVSEENTWQGYVEKIMDLFCEAKLAYRGRSLHSITPYFIRADKEHLLVESERSVQKLSKHELLHTTPLSLEAKTLLSSYLLALWDRKTTQIDLHFFQEIAPLNPQFLLFEATRRMLIMLAFFLEVIARKNNMQKITPTEISEVIFLLDAAFMTPLEGIDFSRL